MLVLELAAVAGLEFDVHTLAGAGERPVADIDVLILGSPDRDQLYEALSAAEARLGRPVQVTIREAGWLNSGSGSFHETVIGRPLLKLTTAGDA